jgi:hypothetical protein
MDGNNEVQKSPEVFTTAKQTVALQARLLIGAESLDPNNLKLQKVSAEGLKDISQETFNKLNIASTNERMDYWKNKASTDPSLNTYKAQMKSWASDVVKFVNQENFTEKEAMDMYETYFIGDGKISAIDRYVINIVNEMKQLKQSKTDVNLDEILEQGLPEIKKMANIFGANSSELIEASIRAKLNLIDENKKQEFVNQINEEVVVSQAPQTRLNHLNSDEDRLLRWLDQNQTLNISKSQDQRPNPNSGEYYWRYRRLEGDVRIFPKELTYSNLANELKIHNPQAFGDRNDQELIKFVKQEIAETQTRLDKFGLTQQELNQLSLDFVDKKVISHYREFIKKKYLIDLPITEQIQILPLSKTLSKAYNNSENALAFVDVKYPVIFLNVEGFVNYAQEILGKPWDNIELPERKEYFRRILTEINPHEYTHLLGDLAFWELNQHSLNIVQQEKPIMSGKLGPEVIKPKKLPDGNFGYQQRGTGLMEAITVELTDRWVQSMGPELTKFFTKPTEMKLDIQAYQGERQVLFSLMNLISQEKVVSPDEVFETFVRSYFTKDGLREMTQLLDKHVKTTEGKFSTQRPHFTSIIYAMMEYESQSQKGKKAAPIYPLTLNFISGKLTEAQKQEILTNINKLEISPLIKNHLSTLLGSTI